MTYTYDEPATVLVSGVKWTDGAIQNLVSAVLSGRTDGLRDGLMTYNRIGGTAYADGDSFVLSGGLMTVGLVWSEASKCWGTHS